MEKKQIGLQEQKLSWNLVYQNHLFPGIALPNTKKVKAKRLINCCASLKKIRNENVAWLRSLNLTESDLDKKGMHPKLGEVTLRNLLATWVVHDLTHIAQITRVMAKQYNEEMGPWPEFFRILSF